jgi:hypothetical protein
LTELVGDIVLNCNGGTPTPLGIQIPQANITIFLNTQVTSRLYTSSNQSEALLTVDEPKPGENYGTAVGKTNTAAGNTGTVCTDIQGCGATGIGPAALGVLNNFPNSTEFKTAFNISTGGACTVGATNCVLNPNTFEGVVSGNSVTFVGVPIDPPGTQGSRIYRITNVRANATIPAPGGSGTPGQIIALISATPATSTTGLTSTFAINNPTQIVAFVAPSLSTSLTRVGTTTALSATDIAIKQCVGVGITGAPNIGGQTGSGVALVGQLNFLELFPTAFKTRTIGGATNLVVQDTLGLVYNAESGYYNTRLPLPSGASPSTNYGLADFGTRLKAVFNNVPNGVSIFVALQNSGTGLPAGTTTPTNGTYAVLTSSETGAFSAVGATTTAGTASGLFQIPIVNGSGTAVWEVLSANPLASQTYSFIYAAIATPSPSTNSPAIGTGTANLSYAPTPTAAFTASAGAVASSSLPIPRFIDTSTAANFIAVGLCRTTLLFPFVTNQSGFDTGLAISNTSTDPFGTAAQQGPCTLNYFGANAPAAVTTASVASGTTYVALASAQAPNFQGYMFAVCNFQYAHGFAFVSDVGARNLAMGYLALVVPDPARGNGASPFDEGGPNSGEQLGF